MLFYVVKKVIGGWPDRPLCPVTLHSKDITADMSDGQKNETVGAVMVVGGGIAGMQSALDLASNGFYVYLVEASPAIGGTMAQLDKTFPTNECAM